MHPVKECYISKSWHLRQETHEDWEVRKKVLEKFQDLKKVHVNNNKLLQEIIHHIPKLFEQNYECPIFAIDGKWFMISRFNFKDYPKSIKVLQNNIVPPDSNGNYVRFRSRVVKIVFE